MCVSRACKHPSVPKVTPHPAEQRGPWAQGHPAPRRAKGTLGPGSPRNPPSKEDPGPKTIFKLFVFGDRGLLIKRHKLLLKRHKLPTPYESWWKFIHTLAEIAPPDGNSEHTRAKGTLGPGSPRNPPSKADPGARVIFKLYVFGDPGLLLKRPKLPAPMTRDGNCSYSIGCVCFGDLGLLLNRPKLVLKRPKLPTPTTRDGNCS